MGISLSEEDKQNSVRHDSETSLQSSNGQLNSLVDLTVSALQQPNFDALLWDVVQQIVDTIGFENCQIYIYDADSNALVQKALYGIKCNIEQNVLAPLSIAFGQGLVGTCAELMEPLLVSDIREDPRYIVDCQLSLSELCVPIISDGNLVGVIDSESLQCDFYTKEHVQLLTAVAAMIATKYQSYQSIDNLQETVHQLEDAKQLQQALFNIAELVYNTDSLDEFYQRMHQYVVDLIDGEVFFVALFNEVDNCIDIPYPGDDANSKYPFPGRIDEMDFSSSLVAEVIVTNRPLRRNDKELNSRENVPEAIVCNWKSYAWLGVPFSEASGISGCVGVQRVSPNAKNFNYSDQELLLYISQHISNAIKRKQDENTLQQLALSDALTGLPNRTLFMNRLQHRLQRDRSLNNFQTHVFFIDLDRFKYINDAYGHHIGDEVLVDVGQRIQSCLRDADTLARISGDEFAIVLEDIDQSEVLDVISKRIVDVFQDPIDSSAGEIKVSASVGICSASVDLCEGEELLKMADHAMYQAKAAGLGEVVVSSQTGSEISHTRRVEAELASAFASEELELFFQPIYRLTDRSIVGFEVLTRWRHPELGLLYPDKFIDIAEKSGQIIALDYYILSKSADLLQQWQEGSVNPSLGLDSKSCYLNVNVSGRTLASAGFVDEVKGQYQRCKLLPGSLNIELTEQSLIGDVLGATERLTELSELGVSIFLDDFGTGYSSLNYLHRLPIDALKIDRSFVQAYHQSDAAESIVKVIVMLAQSLGIGIVAEGLEEDRHLSALTDLSVDRGQGYLLAKPMPLEQLYKLLATCPVICL